MLRNTARLAAAVKIGQSNYTYVFELGTVKPTGGAPIRFDTCVVRLRRIILSKNSCNVTLGFHFVDYGCKRSVLRWYLRKSDAV